MCDKTKPEQLRTREGKHSMVEWWGLSETAEKPYIPLYANFMGEGDLVFDIGANRGRKTWVFRQLGASVVAVEPLAVFFQEWIPELYWKFAKDAGVHIVAAAVDQSRNSIPFWIHRNMPYLSSGDKPWRTKSAHRVFYNDKNSQKVTVPTTTIDALIEQFGIPKFIKMDVEGGEDRAMVTLSRPVPALNMEYHEDWIPETAIRHVDGLDEYEWNFTLDQRPHFVMNEWTTSREMLKTMRKTLTKKGPGSWGDLYARLRDEKWGD